jgi:mono/diheme cytochrome c family protein
MIAILLLAGCKPAISPGKPLTQLTAQELSGYEVYVAKCARCHYAERSSGNKGPGLLGLYRQPYMASGAPPTDDRVRAVILRGRNMMPATNIDDQQLDDLMAYLHTL